MTVFLRVGVAVGVLVAASGCFGPSLGVPGSPPGDPDVDNEPTPAEARGIESTLDTCVKLQDRLRAIPHTSRSSLDDSTLFGFMTGGSRPIYDDTDREDGRVKLWFHDEVNTKGRMEGPTYVFTTRDTFRWSVTPSTTGFRSRFDVSGNLANITDFSADCRTRRARSWGAEDGSSEDDVPFAEVDIVQGDDVITGTQHLRSGGDASTYSFRYDVSAQRWEIDIGPEGAAPETHVVEQVEGECIRITTTVLADGTELPSECDPISSR